MSAIPNSELILTPSGAIYHLNLHPDQIAKTILLVGDPDRVPRVSKYFDRIETKVQKREFVTHTGYLNNQRLTVLSTGISTDNIDIVLNELDALVNIDFATRQIKENLTSLQLIRIGTSGSMQADIPIDSILISAFAVGMDNLLHYYDYERSLAEQSLQTTFHDFFNQAINMIITPYAAEGNLQLRQRLGAEKQQGITLTAAGFYAPQGRQLRAKSMIDLKFIDHARQFEFSGFQLTNFEMETAAIYGLANILGHQAVSCNAILANRITNEFSANPPTAEDKLIRYVLGKITS